MSTDPNMRFVTEAELEALALQLISVHGRAQNAWVRTRDPDSDGKLERVVIYIALRALAKAFDISADVDGQETLDQLHQVADRIVIPLKPADEVPAPPKATA